MKIVLALGNPGPRYAATRHNIGWMVCDAVAAGLRVAFVPGRGEYVQGVGKCEGEDVLLVKPTTYMNNSGVAARQVVERFGVEPSEMLVVADEVQFPVGRIQIRPSGSDGGHNGLRSIIQRLESDRFPRLRCGIDRNFSPGEMADYVLSPFAPEENAARDEMIELARTATLVWVVEGIGAAMERFNRIAPPSRREAFPDGESEENQE